MIIKRPPTKIASKYGRLTVISAAPSIRRATGGVRKRWVCQCKCGATVTVLDQSLRSQITRSCGCLKLDILANGKINVRHGLCSHNLFNTWYSMMRRCYNRKDPSFRNYGRRGIYVCHKWHNAKMFIKDMENGHQIGMSIDRLNNNGPYSPRNCRWATDEQQQNNTRRNVLLTIKGQTKTLIQWSRYAGISYQAMRSRIRRGKTGSDIIS